MSIPFGWPCSMGRKRSEIGHLAWSQKNDTTPTINAPSRTTIIRTPMLGEIMLPKYNGDLAISHKQAVDAASEMLLQELNH